MLLRKLSGLVGGLIAASVLGLPGAQAQVAPFEVHTVPWVSHAPRVPHDAWAGQPSYLQAVAVGGNCGTYEFRWDYNGDGAFDSNGGNFQNAPAAWNLGLQYSYPAGDVDRLYVARVEGRCGADVDQAEFHVIVRAAPSRAQKVNRAISNGMWYAHITSVRELDSDSIKFGGVVDTAMMAQAMLNRGHNATAPDTDPLKHTVRRYLHYVLRNFGPHAGGAAEGGQATDLDGNGTVLRIDGEENYAQGPVLEAIASWGDPDYVIPALPTLHAQVRGRSLRAVAHDAAQYFLWSQSGFDHNGQTAGGFSYSPNVGSDQSQVGWTIVGMMAAQSNVAFPIPQWFKDRTYRLADWAHNGRVGGTPGGYGYQGPNQEGAGHGRSGSMLNALGLALDGNADNDLVRQTVRYLGNTFDADVANTWSKRIFAANGTADYYSLFQITKGMRSFRPAIRLIGDANLDWQQRFSDYLVGAQSAAGLWNNDNFWMNGREIVHAIALLVLIPSIFDTPPTAIAGADPLLAGPGDVITFFHSESYPGALEVPFTAFRWNFIDYPEGLDLNGDGVFDLPGEHAPEDLNDDGGVSIEEMVWEVVTDDPSERPTWVYDPDIGFNEEIPYRVTLQVEDNLGRTAYDDESVRIRVSIINHPPVALPHPSGDPNAAYTVVPGRQYPLDGTPSYDPDSDDEPQVGFLADRLTSWDWDLDNNNTFETSGVTAELDVPGDWQEGQNRVAQFRVCDDGQWVGVADAQCAQGDCTLCSTRAVRLTVVANAPPSITLPVGEVSLEEGEVFEIIAEATDADGGDLSFEWVCDESIPSSRDGASVIVGDDQGLFSAGSEPTVAHCTVFVTDDLGLTTTAEVTVTITNADPVVDEITFEQDPVEGVEIVFDVAATDPSLDDATHLVYDIDCDGDGLLDIEGDVSGSLTCAYPDDGDFTVTVIVTDPDGASVVHSLDLTVLNLPPVIEPIECPPTVEGTPVIIPIVANDPGTDVVSCGLQLPIPGGALVNGCSVFWTPTYAQAVAGVVDFMASANDGEGSSSTSPFQCRPLYLDADEDGLPDTWEAQNGVDDPDMDSDGDGLTDGEEFEAGTDPNRFDGVTPPILLDPTDLEIVGTLTPSLVLRNAQDNNPRGGALRYDFHVYSDAGLLDRVTASGLVAETPNTTAFTVPDGDLEENQTYYWTARAFNGLAYGETPAPESFIVDAVNDTPSQASILLPEDGDQIGTVTPTFLIDNASDPDPGDDSLFLECEIASDADFEMIVQVARAEQSAQGSTAVTFLALIDHAQYWVRCRAVDGEGGEGDWSTPVSFEIESGNLPPAAPTIVSPLRDSVVRQTEGVTLVVGDAVDPEGDDLTYRFEFSADPLFPEAETTVSAEVPEGLDGSTSYRLVNVLDDNRQYFWRARARDDRAAGPSVTSRFRVDVANEPPTAPLPINPAADTNSEPRPRFVWGESTDPEGDPVTYNVGLYRDPDALGLIWEAQSGGLVVDFDGAEALRAGDYFWRVRARDAVPENYSPWSTLIHFVVEGGVVVVPDAAVVEADGPAIEPDAALPDATEQDATEQDATEQDAALPDAAKPDEDVVATVDPDMAETADAGPRDQIRQSVTGSSCTTASPSRLGGGLAVWSTLALLAFVRRRRG